jgi:hypothetical protein
MFGAVLSLLPLFSTTPSATQEKLNPSCMGSRSATSLGSYGRPQSFSSRSSCQAAPTSNSLRLTGSMPSLVNRFLRLPLARRDSSSSSKGPPCGSCRPCTTKWCFKELNGITVLSACLFGKASSTMVELPRPNASPRSQSVPWPRRRLSTSSTNNGANPTYCTPMST